MRILKNSLVLVLIVVMTVSIGEFSNLSFANEKAEEAIKTAKSDNPELKPGNYLSLDKSPTITFKKKNSKKLLIKMKDGTGFKSINYQYEKGNKNDKLANVARKKNKKTRNSSSRQRGNKISSLYNGW